MPPPLSRPPSQHPDPIVDQGPHKNRAQMAVPSAKRVAGRFTARFVGYALVAFLIFAVGLTVAFVIREIRQGEHAVRVQFSELSTLGPGDPVVERGVTVGTIRRIDLEEGRAIAEIQFFHRTPIAHDARFVNLGHSLMGARKVWLLPGSSPEPLDPRQLQQGLYVAGVPETLHKVDALTARVTRLRILADTYFPSPNTSGARAFDAWRRLDQAAQTLGSLSVRLDEAATTLRKGMEAVTDAATAGDRLTTGLQKAEPKVSAAVSRADEILAALAPLENRIEVALGQVERLAIAARDTTAAGRLLADRSGYEKILKGLSTLDSAMRILRNVGLGDDMKINAKLGNPTP